jgi:hypothetical protein
MFFFGLGGILLLIYIILLLVKPSIALLVALPIKPVMDMAYGFSFLGGLTLGRIMAVLVVINFFVVIAINLQQFDKIFARFFILGWIVLAFLSYVMTGLNNILGGLEQLFRYLNFLMPFLAMPFVINRNEKLFFKILILASMLPILITILQILGMPVGNFENTIGSLSRPRGFFHDIFTNRLYFLYGLVGSSYFLIRGQSIRTKAFSFIVFILSTICMFNMYSKSGYVIIFLFSIMLLLYMNIPFKFPIIIAIFAIFVIFLVFNDDTIVSVYKKEIDFLLGKEKVGRLFQGRVFGWQEAISDWAHSETLNQFFGKGDSASGMHNDYLRILVSNGLIGLAYYLFFLSYIFINLLLLLIRKQTFEFSLSLVLFLAFAIDSIGLVPTLYPAYNWMVWGLISFFISRGVNQHVVNEEIGELDSPSLKRAVI